MRPLLTALSDGTERPFNDLVPILEDQFSLTDDERAHLLPSGKQPTFRNRVHWGSFYLLKAGLLERPRRGHLRLTARGADALCQDVPINAAFLRQFPEFREFARLSSAGGGEAIVTPGLPEPPPQTPEEQLDAGYLRHRQSLASDQLAKLRECSPSFFEQVVVDLLVVISYGGSRCDSAQAGQALR
jgi:restriction system protein